MPDPKKAAVAAIDHALADHGVDVGSETTTAPVKTEAGNGKADETPGKPVVQKTTEKPGETQAEDSSSGSEVEPSAETSDAPESEGDESVQQLVDTAIERALAKHGRERPTEEGQPSTEGEPSKGRSQLLKELQQLLGDKGPKLPRSLADVDLTNPVAVQSFFDRMVDEKLSKTVGPWVRQAEVNKVDAEFTSLQTRHPDFHKYGKSMSNLIGRHPTLSLEDAYVLASSVGRKEAGRQEAYDNMTKKKAATLDNSSAKPKTSDGPTKIKSVREAVLRAMDESGASFGQ